VILGLVSVVVSACSSMIGEDSSLKVGMEAPSLRTKTLADVNGDFSRITSYRYPDERMYVYSIDEALNKNKIVVVEFATPGHCTVCDKQLQMLKGIMDRYGDQVLFLHMDQYQNPEAFTAYRVMGDPWTFVIDKKGVVQVKQAGRMLYEELNYSISKLLKSVG
jgi:thiol-disulfide isomerase/thioredoxin